MSRLGVLPAIPIAVGAGIYYVGSEAGGAAYRSYESGWLDNLLQVVGLKDAPRLPASSSPAAQPPKAPITAPKMTTWSPDDLAEAEAQRGAQYQVDTAARRAAADSNGPSGWPSVAPVQEGADTTFWLLVAAGLIGVVIIARKV